MFRLISILLILIGIAAAALGGWTLLGVPQQAAPPPPVASAPAPAAIPAPAPAEAARPTSEEPTFAAESVAPGSGRVAALREVPIAHEAPDEAIMGQVFEVSLAIDATGAISAAPALPGRGNVVEGTAMAGGDAKALLTGTAFEIEPLSPETQALSEFAANTWRWRVSATDSGPQDLVLEIFAMDGDRALPVRSFRDTVTVQVTTVGRLVDAADAVNPLVMLLGGIGSILGGALGLFRLFRN